MSNELFKLRNIRRNEISSIRDLPPRDWNLDIEQVYNRHFGQDYFYPVVAVIKSEIVGTGIAIVHENAAWLGTIIVRDEHRNKGIGNAITRHLIEYSNAQGVETVILAASDMGLPIYSKIGFLADVTYLHFKTDNPPAIDSTSNYISEISQKDHKAILDLDLSVSGEKRKKVLVPALRKGFKYKDDSIKGFYLPDFGVGLIIAETEAAGTELLKFRLSRNSSAICIPETNRIAIDFIASHGFYQFSRNIRMFLNKNVNWKSNGIYARGCGYLG
jgi:GNAT superfamily N-acetyltransferase